jgi:hypothetical protein
MALPVKCIGSARIPVSERMVNLGLTILVVLAQRFCRKFRQLVSATDFSKEAANWPVQVDSTGGLVFVAYFVLEA